MADRPLSPFVLEKIRQRRAAAAEPEEETEEPEEEAEDEVEEEAEEEHETGEEVPERTALARPEPRARVSRRGGSLTDRVSKFFKRLGPTESWILLGGGILLANHLMVPRGTSVLSKILGAIAPAPPPRRLSAPSYYAGANRSLTPLGPWETSPPPLTPYTAWW